MIVLQDSGLVKLEHHNHSYQTQRHNLHPGKSFQTHSFQAPWSEHGVKGWQLATALPWICIVAWEGLALGCSLGARTTSSFPTVNVLVEVTFKHIYILYLIKDAHRTHLGNLILGKTEQIFMGKSSGGGWSHHHGIRGGNIKRPCDVLQREIREGIKGAAMDCHGSSSHSQTVPSQATRELGAH